MGISNDDLLNNVIVFYYKKKRVKRTAKGQRKEETQAKDNKEIHGVGDVTVNVDVVILCARIAHQRKDTNICCAL